MIEVKVWADNSWEIIGDGEENEAAGDDYMIIEVPDNIEIDGIDEYIHSTKPQG